MKQTTKPLCVLALTHSTRLDGAEQVFLDTAAGLHDRGHRILAVGPGEGPLSTALASRGVTMSFQPLPWWMKASGEFHAPSFLTQLGPQVQSLVDRIQTHTVDVVWSNTSVLLHGGLAARIAGIPHCWQIHEMLGQPDCGLDPTLGTPQTWHLIHSLADELCVASNAMRRLVQDHVTEARPTVLPHGHDLSAYLALDTEIPPGNTIVVIASLIPRKGLDWLIRLVAEHLLPEGLPDDFHIQVIGARHDPDYARSLESLAVQLRVDRYFTFPGYRTDLPELLAKANGVLHPSRNDPSPVGLILAMAAGRRIIATRCGGPENMLEQDVSGKLVDVDDATGYAAEIRLLLNDPKHGKSWGTAAREKARTTWALEPYLAALEERLHALAGMPRKSTDIRLDQDVLAAILMAIARHATGSDGVTLTPRQQKALAGIRRTSTTLKKILPENLYNRLADLL